MAAGGMGGEDPPYDINNVLYLRRDMEKAFALNKECYMAAAQVAEQFARNNASVQNGARAMTEALNLPGAPVPPTIPPVMLKPPKRPRDLSPFWLDIPYGVAGSLSGDPYAHHDDSPRDAMHANLFGYPGFNPFEGNVPFSDVGLSGFYDAVKPVEDDGKLEPGITLPMVPDVRGASPVAPPTPPG
jgi:hypothetical protein